MNPATTLNRIKWRSRRGMLELDLALERFLSKHYEHLSPRECESLETLLATNDVELLRWLQGEADPIDSELRELVTKIR